MTTPSLQEQMKQAMGRLGASVTVVTSHNGARKFAMTATAVTSLSLDPPAILVCVNQEADIHTALSHGHDFCVNILFDGQEHISNACAGLKKGESKFNEGDWQEDGDVQ